MERLYIKKLHFYKVLLLFVTKWQSGSSCSPPEDTINWVLTFPTDSISHNHTPRTDYHCLTCFSLDSLFTTYSHMCSLSCFVLVLPLLTKLTIYSLFSLPVFEPGLFILFVDPSLPTLTFCLFNDYDFGMTFDALFAGDWPQPVWIHLLRCLVKPRMDPQSVDASLQKTSPDSYPSCS